MNRITLAIENDFEGKVIASFDLEEYAKQIRADAVDEILKHQTTIIDDDGIIHKVIKVKDIEQLKEQNND